MIVSAQPQDSRRTKGYLKTPSSGRGVLAIALALALCASAQQMIAQQTAADHWMQQGANALRQGDAAQAEEDFRYALTLSPGSADATLGLGLAQLREGKMEDAAAELAKASALDPAMRSAHMFRGIALFQMNATTDASRELEQEIALQPKSVEALTWLGIIDLQAGKPKDACIPLDAAGDLSPADQTVLYYQVRAHTLAAQQSFRALFQIDGDSAFVHRAQAEIFSESQQPDKAIAEYQAAIRNSPTNAELYEALGDEQQRVSHVAEATAAYQAELALNPRSAVALFNLGKILVETGDAGLGVSYLQRAIAAHAAAAPAYFYLGFGLAKTGKDQEAVGWLEKVLSSAPSDLMQQRDEYELVRVYQKLGRKEESARALEALKKLKAQSAPPKNPH